MAEFNPWIVPLALLGCVVFGWAVAWVIRRPTPKSADETFEDLSRKERIAFEKFRVLMRTSSNRDEVLAAQWEQRDAQQKRDLYLVGRWETIHK